MNNNTGFPKVIKILAIINGVISIPIGILGIIIALAFGVEGDTLSSDIIASLSCGYTLASIAGAISVPLVKKIYIALIIIGIALIIGLLFIPVLALLSRVI